jgi:hypothetical protein
MVSAIVLSEKLTKGENSFIKNPEAWSKVLSDGLIGCNESSVVSVNLGVVMVCGD